MSAGLQKRRRQFWLPRITALGVGKEIYVHCMAAPTETGYRIRTVQEGRRKKGCGGLCPGDVHFSGDTDNSDLW